MQPDALVHLIKRSCEIKAEVVGEDEREGGLRAILNSAIPWPRRGVAHGLHRLQARRGGIHRHGRRGELGVALGLCAPDVAERLTRLLYRFGLPTEFPKNLSFGAVLESIGHDKKAEGGKVKFVLPKRIGEVVITKEWDKRALFGCL